MRVRACCACVRVYVPVCVVSPVRWQRRRVEAAAHRGVHSRRGSAARRRSRRRSQLKSAPITTGTPCGDEHAPWDMTHAGSMQHADSTSRLLGASASAASRCLPHGSCRMLHAARLRAARRAPHQPHRQLGPDVAHELEEDRCAPGRPPSPPTRRWPAHMALARPHGAGPPMQCPIGTRHAVPPQAAGYHAGAADGGRPRGRASRARL